MNELFLSSLLGNGEALMRIFLIAAVGALLVRTKIFSSADITSFSSLIVKVLLPAMVFAKIIKGLRPGEMEYWWIIPLIGIGLIGIGLVFATLLFAGNLKEKRNMIPIASMQNAGYLALPLGQVLYPDQFDRYALYCSMIFIGVNPLLWSIGKVLSTDKKEESFRWLHLITPPLVGVLLAVVLVLTGLYLYIPAQIVSLIDLTGDATVPVANLVLGGALGSISIKKIPPLQDILKVLSVKYLIIPVITFYALLLWNIRETDSLLSDVIMIQAALPPATAIIIQIKNYGGDEQKSGSMMLLSYLFCLIAVPFWLSAWKIFAH